MKKRGLSIVIAVMLAASPVVPAFAAVSAKHSTHHAAAAQTALANSSHSQTNHERPNQKTLAHHSMKEAPTNKK